MARLGLDADAIRARNPRLIYASISGYGQTGPWVKRRAYAPVVEAESGIVASRATPEVASREGPAQPRRPVHVARDRLPDPRPLYATHRRGPVDRRVDGRDDAVRQRASPRRAVDATTIRSGSAASAPVTISCSVANGESLVVSGHPAERGSSTSSSPPWAPDLADDPRFVDVPPARELRCARGIIRNSPPRCRRRCIRGQFSKHQLAVVAWSPGEVTDTEWARERNAVVEVDDRAEGRSACPTPRGDSGVTRRRRVGDSQYRGEDNRSLLSELLGYDNARLDELEAGGVLSSRMPTPDTIGVVVFGSRSRR